MSLRRLEAYDDLQAGLERRRAEGAPPILESRNGDARLHHIGAPDGSLEADLERGSARGGADGMWQGPRVLHYVALRSEDRPDPVARAVGPESIPTAHSNTGGMRLSVQRTQRTLGAPRQPLMPVWIGGKWGDPIGPEFPSTDRRSWSPAIH